MLARISFADGCAGGKKFAVANGHMRVARGDNSVVVMISHVDSPTGFACIIQFKNAVENAVCCAALPSKTDSTSLLCSIGMKSRRADDDGCCAKSTNGPSASSGIVARKKNTGNISRLSSSAGEANPSSFSCSVPSEAAV